MSLGELELLSGGGVIERRPLVAAQPLVIGRGEKADWRVESEPFLSRRHVEVSLADGVLKVRKLPEASNPILRDGAARDEFILKNGESFVIGRSKFRFTLTRSEGAVRVSDERPKEQRTLDSSELYAAGGTSAAFRLRDLLELPEILRTRDRAGFYAHIAGMLRLATGAVWSCVLTEDGRVLGEDSADDLSRFAASRMLLRKAVKEAPQPTIYSWSDASGGLKATAAPGTDWAICAAAKITDESAVAFYVSGRSAAEKGSRAAHLGSARFVGLVADIVGRSLSADRLQAQERRLEHYFSGPVVKKILKSANPEDLEPKQAEGTVLFFDIRGFSKKTEGNMEKMVEYLREIRRVMTAMTEIILAEHGVILQYMGDGILACWNLPYEDPKHIDRACRAAGLMSRELFRITDGWRCGVGLHCGPVVAGAIGSEQIFSYGVMGPVVNQASRIEGITKIVGVPVLVSRKIVERLSPAVAVPVRVGRFQPAGMETPLDLYELAEPPGNPGREKILAEGLAAFEAGQWAKTLEILGLLPAEDAPVRFLLSLTRDYARAAPPGWKGVIALTQK
ncbi:MAG TPA: adenylate/guanylate cyclase domain-containing protein [Elusimicrobiota bacterium]|nr:adenylate/guanylate cyclase domain-containing protein [Elusimicrobiota bacterium]